MPLLTIIVPAFNEESTIEKVLKRIEAAPLPSNFKKEILIINDGSTDTTGKIINKFHKRARILHQKNTGKGGAVRSAFLISNGDFVIVQDADLEQDPEDFILLLQPIIDGDVDVVFGSRFMGQYKPSNLTMWFHMQINNFYSLLVNAVIGYKTTDVWTGYKMFSRSALDAVLPHLQSNGIEFELEIAILLGKSGMRVKDIPINYIPRWYKDGKKTNLIDALRSLWKLFGFALRRID